MGDRSEEGAGIVGQIDHIRSITEKRVVLTAKLTAPTTDHGMRG